MIVAVFAVLAVDVTVNDVIDMPGVRNRDVLAADTVLMLRGVRVAGVARVAGARSLCPSSCSSKWSPCG